MRSFDPRAVGRLECRTWETYDPDGGAGAHDARFYRLLCASEHTGLDPVRAAALEVEWWRAHRVAQLVRSYAALLAAGTAERPRRAGKDRAAARPRGVCATLCALPCLQVI